MKRIISIPTIVLALAACDTGIPRPNVPPPTAVAPLRGAAGNADLVVMVAELASSHACANIRGGFHGLRDPDHPEVVTGIIWIRTCEVHNEGAHATFHVGGNGWLWVDQTKSQMGGTFAVQQYVRFGIDTTIEGALDIAYDQKAHIVSLWFTPDRAPAVKLTTLGDIDVDSKGVWSSIVGTLGTALTSSPEDLAEIAAESQGTHELGAQLATGLGVTVNLCTGLTRAQLGRLPKGEMGPAGIGESQHVPVELHPGGVLIIGPQQAGEGMTLAAQAQQGAVRLTLVCEKQAETVAKEYLAGEITSKVSVLGSVDVRTQHKATLQIKPTVCPVLVVVSPLDNAFARFAWERPSAEIARSTGGPLIHCPK